jgi:thiol-disulfide isomerase/thioredoxin
MRRRVLMCAVLISISTASAFAQNLATGTPLSGLELLKQVASGYKEAKSYDIASVEERTSSNELSHTWQKTMLTAALAPGGRFHYEGHSSSGSAMKVADGKTVWSYRVDEHRYTAKPSNAATKQTMIVMSEYAMSSAENLRDNLAALAKGLKSANRLPDATIKVNGSKIRCLVVRIQASDEKRASPGYSFDKTIWIDKTHLTLVKTTEHAHTYLISGASRIPLEEQITTLFTRAELNALPDENLFNFVPPSDAKLMKDFPDPSKDYGDVSMTGLEAPPLKLKSVDGKVITLDSFRGKPVILDFWATWCGPCVDALSRLAQIEKEAKDKGLVLLTVDQDEEADTAIKFLKQKGYTWSNFHDGDGEIENLAGSTGIPRTMLIDPQGKIVYDAVGTDEDALRTEITKLGPEYSALAPKPKPVP